MPWIQLRGGVVRGPGRAHRLNDDEVGNYVGQYYRTERAPDVVWYDSPAST